MEKATDRAYGESPRAGEPAVTAHGMPPRMIALDVDYTLLRTGEPVPEVTVEAVGRVQAAGHRTVLASARSLNAMLPVAQQLGITEGWLIAANGAITVRLTPDAPRGFVVEQMLTFDAGPVIRLAMATLPGVRVAVEDVDGGVHLVSERVVHLLGDQNVVLPEELWARPAPHMILGADLLVAHLVEPVRALGVTVHPSGTRWLDVTAAGVNKAAALEAVRQRLGIALEHTVAVGDGVNDLEMLRWAGRSVAMGHAPAVVRDAAHEITGTIDEHGVVPVLDSLLPSPAAEVTVLPPTELTAQVRAVVEK